MRGDGCSVPFLRDLAFIYSKNVVSSFTVVFTIRLIANYSQSVALIRATPVQSHGDTDHISERGISGQRGAEIISK